MTIDEEINRFEGLASDYEFNLEMHQHNVMKLSVNDIERMKRNAQENRQRAEWLKELKAYKEELPKEIKNAKVRQANVLEANVKNENYNPYLAEYIKGYICGLSYTEGIIAKIIEEVNADE